MNGETAEAGTLALVWLWLRSAVLLFLFLLPGILLFCAPVVAVVVLVTL